MTRSFPPHTCRYSVRGTCLYDEMRNPGRVAAFRCLRLEALMEEWDDFLDRAEAFHLDERTAARLWNERRHAALDSIALCPFTQPAGLDEGGPEPDRLNCLHLFRGACVLAMPPCRGICPRYARNGKEQP